MWAMNTTGREGRKGQPSFRKDAKENRTANVGVAIYENKHMVAVVLDNQPGLKTSRSGRTNIGTAEKIAITLAITGTTATITISDSKVAVGNFPRVRVAPQTKRLLDTCLDDRTIQIIWAPAHLQLQDNKAARKLAHGLPFQMSSEP